MPEEKKLPSLESLQKKIDQAKRHSSEENKPRSRGAADSTNVGQGMRFVVELASGLVVGAAVGYFIDRWLHTFPWFFIVCFFLGAAAGFRNLLRDAGQDDDQIIK
ncbi:MAG: AtpZ/AtpI family protein [Pseudomonadota bacterium]|nr:AtpZ/AtpI family protein [Pseudomonadota bacterium]